MQTTRAFPGAVTVHSLLAAIRSAVDSGRIGTPVSVRLHWEFSEIPLRDAAVLAVRIADEALALEQPAWRVRTGNSDRLLNVLGEDRQGRTLLITVCRGTVRGLGLTVFGNHGVLRLEHAGLEELSQESPENIKPELAEPVWQQRLLQSIG